MISRHSTGNNPWVTIDLISNCRHNYRYDHQSIKWQQLKLNQIFKTYHLLSFFISKWRKSMEHIVVEEFNWNNWMGPWVSIITAQQKTNVFFFRFVFSLLSKNTGKSRTIKKSNLNWCKSLNQCFFNENLIGF